MKEIPEILKPYEEYLRSTEKPAIELPSNAAILSRGRAKSAAVRILKARRTTRATTADP